MTRVERAGCDGDQGQVLPGGVGLLLSRVGEAGVCWWMWSVECGGAYGGVAGAYGGFPGAYGGFPGAYGAGAYPYL